ncbi:substrate-binding domain-containing protein [Falsiroseomonas tokyonensis]|uniref:ABC transporter substrate-binding protein n=1 Tax=Falsiroseomonas tokyonensis TaxID=430521 RepID=A0ABV7BUW1_9PROT|nr:ABC transporter substrate-binding protein [Falsiroseomonas tokyonensis]MBU8539410.1 ABC transporter substrate-binding protein [Falsiroseomonas tokyonensis]
MTAKLPLTLACNLYDRSLPLLTGQVEIEGCAVNFVPIAPEEAHARAFNGADFDVTEMSLSSHLLATSRGGSPYLALPAFISRAFRHSCIYIRKDSGLRTPADLRGKVMGVPEYQMTAAVWTRGIISDDYGVRSEEIAWRTGGLNMGGRKERMALDLPAGFDVRPIGDATALSDALVDGRIDALLTARAPACYDNGHPDIIRMFEDYRPLEEDWFRRTGIFPIIHAIGLRRDLAEQHRWLPRSVFKAFLQAKTLAQRNMWEMGFLTTSHPWLGDEARRLRDIMGEDPWPYGLEPNRKTVETLIRYAREQGLIHRAVTAEELVFPHVSDKAFAI